MFMIGDMDGAYNLIATKLAPSGRVDDHIGRDDLIDKLNASLSRKLCIVHAPAGYGKTSILIEWRARLLQDDRIVVWLGLDEDDNDPLVFMTYLIAAFKQCPRTGELLREVSLRGLGDLPARSTMTQLIGRLSNAEDDIVLIIDNLEAIKNNDVYHLIQLLIAGTGINFHLTLAGRELPPLDIADLTIHDEVVQLSSRDLRMSFEQARALLSPDSTARLSDAEVRLLTDRSEGWVIALKMYKLCMNDTAPQPLPAEDFSGRTAELANYLSEQVLQSQPAEIQEFLLHTSVVDRLNGDLANRLRDRDDSWLLLEKLEREDLFIFCLDTERRWFRYHGLFREFLLERLKRTNAGCVARLYGVASQWFLQQGFLSEAIRYAQKSGDTRKVAAALEDQGGWRIYVEGRPSVIRAALERIPREVWIEYPRLSLAEIYCQLKDGRLAAARRRFDEFRGREGDLTDHTDSSLAIEAAIMDYIIRYCQDEPITPAQLKAMERLARSVPADDKFLAATIHNNLCIGYLNAGRFDQAIEAGDVAIANFRAVNSLYGEMYIYLHEGKACLLQGRLRDAELLFRSGYEIGIANFGEDTPFCAIAATFLAEALYAKNDLPECTPLVEQALTYIDQSEAWIDVYYSIYRVAISLALVKGGIDSAIELVERAERVALERDIPRLNQLLQVQRVLCHLRCGDLDNAQALCDEYRFSELFGTMEVLDWAGGRVFEAVGLALARIDVLRGEPASAVDLLTRVETGVNTVGPARNLYRAELVRAAAWYASGEQARAIECFNAVVTQVLFEGFKRVFIDEALVLMPLLKTVRGMKGARSSNRLRDLFVKEVVTTADRESRKIYQNSRRDTLTRREHEVLRRAGQGYSNKEIALRMDVGENTVKFHLKNIFKKLHVDSRRQAIVEARERELI